MGWREWAPPEEIDRKLRADKEMQPWAPPKRDFGAAGRHLEAPVRGKNTQKVGDQSKLLVLGLRSCRRSWICGFLASKTDSEKREENCRTAAVASMKQLFSSLFLQVFDKNYFYFIVQVNTRGSSCTNPLIFSNTSHSCVCCTQTNFSDH